jgi:branched-chain amino acid transport system ATP-binding protein
MSAPLLRLDGLTRRFGGLVAVNAVDLAVPAGSVHGLIGPNGAGKTTLFNLVSGHLRPSAGVIALAGVEVTRWPPDRRAVAGVRRTFQNLRLFREMTALGNVMVGLHAQTRCEIVDALLRLPRQRREERMIEARAREALEFVGLADAAGQIAGSLPYGHQRLLEIARAIAGQPRLLLLDEPAAGLNNTEAGRMIALIGRIKAAGVTVLLVEHHMHVVMKTCDTITVLNYGSRLAQGSPADIRAHPEVIAAYLGKSDLAARSGAGRAAVAAC